MPFYCFCTVSSNQANNDKLMNYLQVHKQSIDPSGIGGDALGDEKAFFSPAYVYDIRRKKVLFQNACD